MFKKPVPTLLCGVLGITAACSSEDAALDKRQVVIETPSIDESDQSYDQVAGTPIQLKKAPGEKLLSSLTLQLNSQVTAALTDGSVSYQTDLEETVDVRAEVTGEKYLNVISEIDFATGGDGVVDIGCVYIDLKDNVSYREQSLLRIASTGIVGENYSEVSVPLLVKKGSWQEVPIVDDAFTLAVFAENTVKKFKGELCFQLDLRDAPAQSYAGQIVVQYLLADGDSRDYDDDVGPNLDNHTCSEEPKLLRAAQKAQLSFNGVDDLTLFDFRLSGDDSKDLGALNVSNEVLVYSAPDAVESPTELYVVAAKKFDDVLPEFCPIKLIPDDNFFEEDDGVSQAIVGNVYKLEKNTKKLPNFQAMNSIASVMVPNFAVAKRRFDQGFPGVAALDEWFGIAFTGQIYIEEACDCEFKLNSDDGANLYINGQKVIDNDGLHAPRAETGSIYLEKGFHRFAIDYYQGPRYLIALELFWSHQGTDGFEIVPPAAFFR